MFKKIDKHFIFYLIASIGIFAFVFRDLILNTNTNLIDWRDYALVVWIVEHFSQPFLSLNFNGIFDGNIFYPLKGTMLFTEILWPQSLITAFFSLFTDNIITRFNYLFYTTLLLNTISIYFFWDRVFQKKNDTFFASLLTNFSPFFFLQLSHFQMISYWPTFISLGFLFDKKKTDLKLFLAGLFLSIQFYAAVYWAIFLITIIGTIYLVKLLKKENIVTLLKELIIIGIPFLLIVGPIFLKYKQVKEAYSINRDYGEYITYSAHLTDYIFNWPYKSLLSESVIFNKINSLNRHFVGALAGSPTIIIALLSFVGMFTFRNKKNEFTVGLSTKRNHLIFLFILIIGFVFSLGPRLSINGNYFGLPLPFDLALKYLFIYEPIRATARFSALFYLALFYFATIGLNKINRNNSLLISVIALLLFLLEVIPANFTSEGYKYYPNVYDYLERRCEKCVILEYPFNQNTDDSNVATNLRYKASLMTASVHHNYNLVNGYIGFDPVSHLNYINSVNQAIESTNSSQLNKLIEEKNLEYIKINHSEMSDTKNQLLENISIYNSFGEIIYMDDYYSLIKINITNNE